MTICVTGNYLVFGFWLRLPELLWYMNGDVSTYRPALWHQSNQQKNIELKTQGRRPFDATGPLPIISTAYQYPYPVARYQAAGVRLFPEKLARIHAYLAVRFSEYALSLDEDIVPDVRFLTDGRDRWKK